MKASELREKDIAALNEELLNLRKERFNFVYRRQRAG